MNGAQVMFVQGGAGDINPLFEGRSGKEDEDFKVMQTMGEEIEELKAKLLKLEGEQAPH